LNLIAFLTWMFYLIPRLDFLGDHANFIGFLWLLSLVIVFFKRIRKPEFPLMSRKQMIPLVRAFLIAWLFQIGIDEVITMPLNLLSGSWIMMQPGWGNFTLLKLIDFKADVYFQIIAVVYSLLISGAFQKHYQFTRKSLFWFSTILLMQLVLSFHLHWWNYRTFPDPKYSIVFWSSYPEFRVLSGFFAVSIIKKPRAKS
jgi:hypothetical protein